MLDPKDILKFTAGDSKPKGIAKLSSIILNKSQKSLDRVFPEIDNIKMAFKDGCPTPDVLKGIIIKRNNLLSELDDASIFIEGQRKTIDNLNIAFKSLETGIKTIKKTKKGISLGSKFIPSPPGVPGAIASGISDLGDIILDIIFTPTGSPKLEKLKSQSNSLQSAIDISSNTIAKISSDLLMLDALINPCLVNFTQDIKLSPPSALLNGIISKINQSSLPGTALYRGYILKLEKKKFNERLTQNRAIATNRQNIIKYSTEYSFTLDPNDLIDELKQILDRVYDSPDDGTDLSGILGNIEIQNKITQLQSELPIFESQIPILEQENQQLYFEAYEKTYPELSNIKTGQRIGVIKDTINREKTEIKKLQDYIEKNKNFSNLSSTISVYKNVIKDKESYIYNDLTKQIEYIQSYYIDSKENKRNKNKSTILDLKKKIQDYNNEIKKLELQLK